MSDSPYNSQPAIAAMRRQAWRVWAIGLAVVVVWVLAITLPPIARAGELYAVSNPLYAFFSYICHQIPERSFHVVGHQLAVCSRCFGVYFGLLAGFAVYPFWRPVDSVEPPPRFWLFLSLVPISIDWSLTMFGILENTQISRFITGLILGVACATFILPAIVEITRSMTVRRPVPVGPSN